MKTTLKKIFAIALSLFVLFSVPVANAVISSSPVTVAISLGPLAESLTVTTSSGTLAIPTTGYGPTNASPTLTVTTAGSLSSGHNYVETFGGFSTSTALTNGTQTINAADVFLISDGGAGVPFTASIGTVPNTAFIGGKGSCTGCTAGTIAPGGYNQVDTISLFIDQTAFVSLIPLTTYAGSMLIYSNAV